MTTNTTKPWIKSMNIKKTYKGIKKMQEENSVRKRHTKLLGWGETWTALCVTDAPLRFTKEKQAFYWVLLGLEKETKMTPLPLCKKKTSSLLSLLNSRTQDFIFFSCRSHVTSLAFLNFFLLLSFLFFFVFHLTASFLHFHINMIIFSQWPANTKTLKLTKNIRK